MIPGLHAPLSNALPSAAAMQADSHPCNEMAGVDDIQDADQMMQHALPTQFKKKEVPFPVNLTGRNLVSGKYLAYRLMLIS